MGLVRNVTKENYAKLAVSFSRVAEEAFVICPVPFRQDNEPVSATPREWGAWAAYLLEKNIQTRVFMNYGRAGKPFTVPAKMPSDFDGDWTVQKDFEAANAYVQWLKTKGMKKDGEVYPGIGDGGNRSTGNSARTRWAEPSPVVVFNPFPHLSEAFKDRPELLANVSTQGLQEADKRLYFKGKAAAEAYLEIAPLQEDVMSKVKSKS